MNRQPFSSGEHTNALATPAFACFDSYIAAVSCWDRS